MRIRVVALVALASLAFAAPAYADRHSDAKAQVEFGISVAEKGLWKEAIYRWERAVELDPDYAGAWNDLAVAYEQDGRLDDAKKAYERAMKIAPDDQNIRQNYDLFREIYDQTHRHGG